MIGATVIADTGFAVVQLFPQTIISMFNKDPELMTLGATALRTWFLALPITGAGIIMSNYFQAVGKVKVASFLNLTRQVIVLIPMIMILGSMFGLYGIFYAVPLSELASFSMASFMITRENKKVWSVHKHE